MVLWSFTGFIVGFIFIHVCGWSGFIVVSFCVSGFGGLFGITLITFEDLLSVS